MTDDTTRRAGGIHWAPGALDVRRFEPVGRARALADLRSSVAVLAQSAAALEGNRATVGDARELLAGRSAGLSVDDSRQLRALLAAFGLLADLLADGGFRLEKSTSDRLHAVVAEHEAIESGHFRGEGSVHGGGAVRLTDGRVVEGEPAGAGGRSLIRLHRAGLVDLTSIDDVRERALGYFAFATRRQFYFDGNKRTARLMMNGALVAAGFPAIDVPVARAHEFHGALDRLFERDDATPLIRFTSSCADSGRDVDAVGSPSDDDL